MKRENDKEAENRQGRARLPCWGKVGVKTTKRIVFEAAVEQKQEKDCEKSDLET